MQHEDAVCVVDLVNQVGGPQDRDAVLAGQSMHVLDDVPSGRHVETDRRLVEEQEAWLVYQRPGDLHPAAVTATEPANPLAVAVGDSQPGQFRRDALAGQPVTVGGATLAEGIAVKTPGATTLPIIRELVDRIVVLDEPAIENAVELMADAGRLVVEGAGAVGLGAVLAEPELFRDGVTGLVVSGGNIDMRVLASVLLRGLVRGGQLVRLRIQITDAPGNLARVTRIIGDAGGNIVEIVHQRLFYDVPVKQTDIDVVIETRNTTHAVEIRKKLEQAGLPAFTLSDVAVSSSP